MRSKIYQRSFTNYTPSCDINNAIQQQYNVADNGNQYRKFMQQNGEKLMIQFAEDAYKQTLAENAMLYRTN